MKQRWPGEVPRASATAFSAIAAFAGMLAALALHAALADRGTQRRMAETAELVRRVGLTDLALFTEARYTRHPSQADLHTPFQDHPISFEHFPSGTFMPVPEHLNSGTLSSTTEEPVR